MAGNKDSKLKILRLMDILREQSDEEHPLSSNELIEALNAKYNIRAERKSIYADLDVLAEYGLDIIKTSIPKKGYYLGERDFELAEVRLLVDAVEAAGFITQKKTGQLTEKIESNLSTYQKTFLNSQVYMDQKLKSNNETLYYTVDTLARAIQGQKKVRLHYTKRIVVSGDKPRNEERHFTLSPYALIWSNDHYYLICNNHKYDNFMHIRVDRIKSVEILPEPARNCAEFSAYQTGFDISDYAAKHFNGFSGDPEGVELVCDNCLLQEVVDRFGDNVPIIDTTENTFTIYTTVAISEGFSNWVMQFGEKMLVKKPLALRQQIIERTQTMLAQYEAMAKEAK